MTSGSVSYGTGYPSKGEKHSKSWSGSDGKYEIVNGRLRLKFNNYNMQLYHQSSQLGSAEFAVGDTGSGSIDWPASAEMKLQSKLVKRIKGHDFNLAVNVAQGRQLVDMCVRNVLKFGRSLLFLKRGDFSSAARQLGISGKVQSRLSVDDISGRWLELQYGWLPSISDSFEAAKAYESITKYRVDTIKVKGSYRDPKTEWSAAPTLWSYGGSKVTSKYITYEMTETLSTARSLGLADPLSLAWELIPWSFVIDWFLPVGSYLENLAVLPFLQGRFISTRVGRYRAAFTGSSDIRWKDSKRVTYGINVDRVISSGLNTQRPSFSTLPQAMSPRRLFSAIALVHQRLR